MGWDRSVSAHVDVLHVCATVALVDLLLMSRLANRTLGSHDELPQPAVCVEGGGFKEMIAG